MPRMFQATTRTGSRLAPFIASCIAIIAGMHVAALTIAVHDSIAIHKTLAGDTSTGAESDTEFPRSIVPLPEREVRDL